VCFWARDFNRFKICLPWLEVKATTGTHPHPHPQAHPHPQPQPQPHTDSHTRTPSLTGTAEKISRIRRVVSLHVREFRGWHRSL